MKHLEFLYSNRTIICWYRLQFLFREKMALKIKDDKIQDLEEQVIIFIFGRPSHPVLTIDKADGSAIPINISIFPCTCSLGTWWCPSKQGRKWSSSYLYQMNWRMELYYQYQWNRLQGRVPRDAKRLITQERAKDGGICKYQLAFLCFMSILWFC